MSTRVAGLQIALAATLVVYAARCGPNARTMVQSLRDECVRMMSEAAVPPELERAQSVAPAIEAITGVFEATLRDIE